MAGGRRVAVRVDAPACAFPPHALQSYPHRPPACVLISISGACPLISALSSKASISILHPSSLCLSSALAPYPAHSRRAGHQNSPPLAHLLLNRPSDPPPLPCLPPLSGSMLQLARLIPTPCRTVLPAPLHPSSYPSQAPSLISLPCHPTPAYPSLTFPSSPRPLLRARVGSKHPSSTMADRRVLTPLPVQAFPQLPAPWAATLVGHQRTPRGDGSGAEDVDLQFRITLPCDEGPWIRRPREIVFTVQVTWLAEFIEPS